MRGVHRGRHVGVRPSADFERLGERSLDIREPSFPQRQHHFNRDGEPEKGRLVQLGCERRAICGAGAQQVELIALRVHELLGGQRLALCLLVSHRPRKLAELAGDGQTLLVVTERVLGRAQPSQRVRERGRVATSPGGRDGQLPDRDPSCWIRLVAKRSSEPRQNSRALWRVLVAECGECLLEQADDELIGAGSAPHSPAAVPEGRGGKILRARACASERGNAKKRVLRARHISGSGERVTEGKQERRFEVLVRDRAQCQGLQGDLVADVPPPRARAVPLRDRPPALRS